jgi:hypothetical protein
VSEEDPIRVFIGSELKTRVPCRVLCHTLRKHTKKKVEILIMEAGRGFWQKPPDLRMGTGFSLFRWMIPTHVGFKGKAIYLDADQAVFHDIDELWMKDVTSPGPSEVWAAYEFDKYNRGKPGMQSSVMLIDCEKASYWDMDWMWGLMRKREVSYGHFMHHVWNKFGAANKIGKEWNSFNHYEEGKTKLIHYTREQTQPWYQPQHKFKKVWEQLLIEAIRAGAVPREELEIAISRFGKPEKGDRRRTFGVHPEFRPCMNCYNEPETIENLKTAVHDPVTD